MIFQNSTLLVSGEYSVLLEPEYKNKPIIYCISGLYETENIKTPWYFGSTSNPRERFYCHLCSLRKGNHFNPPLQRSWNKYGEESFVIWQIEECRSDNLLDREQFYLDSIQPFIKDLNGFNIAVNASSPSKGMIVSEETRKKISKAHKGKKISEETRKRMSEVAKKRDLSKETEKLEKYRLNNPNPLKGVSPSEETRKKISEALSGEKSYRWGKAMPDWHKEKLRSCYSNPYEFLSPNGEIFKGVGVKQFSKEHKLDGSSMNKLRVGRIKAYKGWTAIKTFEAKKVKPLKGKYYSFIHESGEIKTGYNLTQFAKEYDLNASTITDVNNGKYPVCGGWRKYVPNSKENNSP